MAKILLVEDDNNLREIYEARLQAEGYQIVAANDGEAALVIAKAENPDLIISDVMMPKISGFEMLDILRNTEELKATKVIMLTALGQADDQSRADKLGADRYLVKSQVTLEDIVRVSHELLGDLPATETPSVAAPTSSPSPTPVVAQPVEEPAITPQPQAPTIEIAAPPAVTTPVASADPAPTPVIAAGPTPISNETIPPVAAVSAQPVNGTTPIVPQVDNNIPITADSAQTRADEEATVTKQIEDFVAATSPSISVASNMTPSPVAPPSNDAAATAQANIVSDDKMLADAVNNLVTSTTTPDAQSPEVTVEPAAETVPAPPAPPVPNADDSSSASGDSAPVAHKKIIQPIQGEPKPDLEALLAAEEAKDTAPQPQIVISGATSTMPSVESPQEDQAAGAPPPTPGSSIQPNNSGIDPNSIAL